MRRYAISLLCLLLVGAIISAAPTSRVSEPGLRVEGETLVIVTKAPFKIIAPPGGKLYFWDLPLGWKHDASKVSVKNVVTVSEAPEGSSVVSAVSVDKDFTPSEYRLVVNVGKVAPPPPPPPSDPLIKALRAAYLTETDPARATHVANLAALYRMSARPVVVDDPALKTWGDLSAKLKAASTVLGVAGKIPAVQKLVAGDLLASGFPTRSDTPLTPDGRATAARAFLKVGAALEEVK